MVSPMTRSPRARSKPATTELSTPPDMATAMVADSGIGGSKPAQVRYTLGQRFDQGLDLRGVVGAAERNAQAGAGLLARQADGEENMRRLAGAAGTCGSARD